MAPPTVKAVGFARLVPVMVINVPIEPLVGEKEEMVGGWAEAHPQPFPKGREKEKNKNRIDTAIGM